MDNNRTKKDKSYAIGWNTSSVYLMASLIGIIIHIGTSLAGVSDIHGLKFWFILGFAAAVFFVSLYSLKR